MLKQLYKSISLLTILLATLGCERFNQEIDYELISLPIQEEARCILVQGDSIMIGGGNTNSTGYFIQSDLGLTDFSIITEGLKGELYSFSNFQNRWYFGLDSVYLFFSDSLPIIEEYYWNEADWVSDLSKHPMRRFVKTETSLLAIAGGKLSFGVIYETEDGKRWNPLEYDNELRALASFGGITWAGGNGRLMRKEGASDWQLIDLKKKFIVDMAFVSEKIGFAVTDGGEILKSSDSGFTWKKIEKGRASLIHRMKIDNDWIIAVGADGVIAASDNLGEDWRWFQMDEKYDLNDFVILNGECLIAAEQGFIVRISLVSLK